MRPLANQVTDSITPNFGPVDIVGYDVVFAAIGEPPAQLDIDALDNITGVTGPTEFLQPDTVYEVEMLATDKGGQPDHHGGGRRLNVSVSPGDCELPLLAKVSKDLRGCR